MFNFKAKEDDYDHTRRQVYINAHTQKVTELADLPEAFTGANCAVYDSHKAMICSISQGHRLRCYSAFAPKGNPADLEFTQVANVANNYVHGAMSHYKHQPVIFCESSAK